MNFFLYAFQWLNLISIMVTLLVLFFTLRRYTGVIGMALMYLIVGITMTAMLLVGDLLKKVLDYQNTQVHYFDTYDVIHSGFITFAFLMIAAGFYKLSKIYKRI